jgi:uncharacterized protein YdhG (YjbR/CyaY superfamily)
MAQTQAGLSEAEKAAARARVKEARAEAKRGADRAAGIADCEGAIAALPTDDRKTGERIYRIETETAPDLEPKTYYGMPAFARDGKVVCFFKPSSKFKERYSTFGFEQAAHLDDGTMWPTGFAVTNLSPADEAKIAELVKKAVS